MRWPKQNSLRHRPRRRCAGTHSSRLEVMRWQSGYTCSSPSTRSARSDRAPNCFCLCLYPSPANHLSLLDPVAHLSLPLVTGTVASRPPLLYQQQLSAAGPLRRTASSPAPRDRVRDRPGIGTDGQVKLRASETRQPAAGLRGAQWPPARPTTLPLHVLGCNPSS